MKGMKTFGVTDYTNLVPLKCCGWKDGWKDGRSGPTTRPAFAKATLVKPFNMLCTAPTLLQHFKKVCQKHMELQYYHI